MLPAPSVKSPSVRTSAVLLRWAVAGAAALLLVVGIYVSVDPGTATAQTVGDFSILLSALAALASCTTAARRRQADARAWTFLAGAMLLWTAGQAVWTYYGVSRNHDYPFPSLADAGFLGYSLLAGAALFSFPRPRVSRVALSRTILDAAVISGAVLFISWDTVLGPMVKSGGHGDLARLTALAYPIVDVVVTSLVLVLAMRRVPGERLPWLFLGGGLMVLTFTDSAYAKLTADGATGATGTLLALGWMAAFLLIALAPLAPRGGGSGTDRRAYTLALELLPYIPVVGAVVVSFVLSGAGTDPFFLLNGVIVLILVVVRQVLIVFENVTLTRDLEQKVATRTAALEGLGAIVNSSTDAIFGTDASGAITSWNPGAERLYGYDAAAVMGREAGFLVPPHLRPREDAILASVLNAGVARTYETQRQRRDGSTVEVSLTVSPIRGELGIRGIAAIGQDITERRAAEGALSSAREAALESSRLKSEFLATMSHEIRTPMNGVVGLTTLLLDTRLDATQRQYAQGVRGAGEALLSLINDILDFSKLEAGKVDLDYISFDPRALVDEVAALLVESARAKDLELIAYCRPEVPATLRGDAGRIRQVLLNLASNAIKFTSTGEVTLRVALVEHDGSEPVVRFDVRDTGIGIDPADHGRLFESFSQADASTTRKYGGTGLGLAISRRLTEAMGGEIGVDSAAGAGSTFWFWLPLAAGGPGAAAPTPSGPDQLTGLKVLVVDDNATNRLVLQSQLAAWRMRPVVVEDAAAALASCRAAAGAGEPYDIAVLDMCMPGMDGLDLARSISADPSLPPMGMIMLTSTAHIDRADLAEAGVTQWLTKPVRSSEFYDRLVRMTAGTERSPAAAKTIESRWDGPSRGRVLIVEDNEVNQLVAREMVAKLGFDVDVVGDGAQAVAATSAATYTVVLMDCHMPVMDGYEATKAIRTRGDAPHLPIIAMTAGALDEDRQRCLAAGMDDYLAKPVDYTALGDTLSRLAGAAPAVVEPAVEPATAVDEQHPALDPARLQVLRSLGPADGLGLLPAAVEAFRSDIPASLAALRGALADGDGAALGQAAHKLKGAAANIGAGAAATLCSELERGPAGSGPDGPDPTRVLADLEAELARVDSALEQALVVR
ncbi:hybrid sensor histidine kinase/response regulator [Arthrobacter sp. 35W]|uniref:hybrid sensor histidine kinase/response regulator n=1 Tax=Arthrobacter sp. 35W TaxID=1132441 RepID=UPI0004159D40|nr:response regulator [Arthrobacter sp. 35W]